MVQLASVYLECIQNGGLSKLPNCLYLTNRQYQALYAVNLAFNVAFFLTFRNIATQELKATFSAGLFHDPSSMDYINCLS